MKKSPEEVLACLLPVRVQDVTVALPLLHTQRPTVPGTTLGRYSEISSDTSIFPQFKLTCVYLDIIELELYPARLPHFATLALQSVCAS